MKKLAVALMLMLLTPMVASATWSVIAIDAKTGQVIIASATCVRQSAFPQRQPVPARDLMDLQAVIIPGVGVAACQAGADKAAVGGNNGGEDSRSRRPKGPAKGANGRAEK